MKTILCACVTCVFLILSGVYLIPGLWHYMSAKEIPRETANGFSEPVERIIPDFFRKRLCLAKLRIAELEARIKDQSEYLASENRILERARELLKANKPGSTIMVLNTKHTWEEINEDFLNRDNYCQLLRLRLERNKQSLNELENMVNNGLKDLAKHEKEGRLIVREIGY